MNTRYPILLVHGLGIKDVLFLRSFGRIDRVLRAQGYVVYTSRIDAFGAIEGNAVQLREEILTILSAEQAEKINLIAHSKGGLDARYMLDHLGMADCVASLTTLCTPHRGTPIASLVMRMPACLVRIGTWVVDGVFRLLGDRAPDSRTACRQLMRTTDLEQGTLRPMPGVFCQSFSSTMRRAEKGNDFIMRIPACFSRRLEKGMDTDGMVPKDSAIYGVYRGDCIDGSVSHTEIVDFMARSGKKEKVYAFYSALCRELAEMGL